MKRRSPSARALWALLLVACQPGAAGRAVQPDAQSAAQAVDGLAPGQCRQVAGHGSPLVVDWTPELRTDLETAMADGIAVVAYDCQTLELLPDCKVAGDYGYVGVTRKEEVIQLEDADEIQANLPAFGARLSAELSRGSTLDLALIMVGKRRTVVNAVDRSELPRHRSCARATHFVRGAYVGAFSMQTGTRGQVRAAAELFGAEASSASRSHKAISRKDGQPERCTASAPGAGAAPEGCTSLLRVELRGLDAAAGLVDVETGACPAGLVLAGGKCTQPRANVASVCSPDDQRDCQAQCDKGNQRSCSHLAYALQYGLGGVAQDLPRAAALYRSACEGDVPHACAGLGIMHERGAGGLARDPEATLRLYDRACAAGDPRGCNNLGAVYRNGVLVARDLARSNELYQRACSAGDATACSNLAQSYRIGEGVPRDIDRAVALGASSCKARSVNGCINLAAMYLDGDGVPPDPARAAELYARACSLESSDRAGAACQNLAELHLVGRGVEKNIPRAIEFSEKGCRLGNDWACRALSAVHRDGVHLPVDHVKANATDDQFCSAGIGGSCGQLGWSYERGRGLGIDLVRARELYRRGCDLGSPWACSNYAALLAAGKGGPADPDQAVALYERACRSGEAHACVNLAGLHESGRGVPRSPERARALYLQACDTSGYALACHFAGEMLRRGLGGDADPKRGFELNQRACQQVSDRRGAACFQAALAVTVGADGLPPSDIRGAALMLEACAAGHAEACAQAAALHEAGRGVPADAARAAELRVKACIAGHTASCSPEAAEPACQADPLRACNALGYHFALGRNGFPRDGARALALFRRGCEAADPHACDSVGEAHELGWGTARDQREAVSWYEKACGMGNRVSCQRAGLAAEKGKGRKADRQKALDWYDRGCTLGSVEACDAADRLRASAPRGGAPARGAQAGGPGAGERSDGGAASPEGSPPPQRTTTPGRTGRDPGSRGRSRAR